MIDWAVVAAFVGPLVGAIGLAAGWFAWIAKRRDKRVADQIDSVTKALEFRITQVEVALSKQSDHLDKQDGALLSAMTAIARIEGRLAGPVDTRTS
jgi:hypothetical protein